MYGAATIELAEAIMRDREREAQRRRQQAAQRPARRSRRPRLRRSPIRRPRPAV